MQVDEVAKFRMVMKVGNKVWFYLNVALGVALALALAAAGAGIASWATGGHWDGLWQIPLGGADGAPVLSRPGLFGKNQIQNK